MDIREFCDTMVPFLIRVNSQYFAVYCHFSFSGEHVSFLYPVSPAECTEYSVCSDLHPTEILCFLFQSRLNFFIPIFFSSPGVSSGPALHPDLYPCWSYETDHPAGPEPAPAAVGTKELRVYLPHPGQHAQRTGSEV